MHLYSEISVLGHLGTDYQGVLIFQFSYMQMDTLGSQLSVQIMQVSFFKGDAELIKSSCTKQFITAYMLNELFWGSVKTLLVYKSLYA